MGWQTVHAPRQEELDACVTCGLCLSHCPTYRLSGNEAASPRGRLAAMAAVADGIAEIDERFDDIMGSCLQCRACEPVCPSLVPFGRAMEGARAEVAAQLPTPATRLRAFGLGRVLASRPAMRVVTAGALVAQRLRMQRLPSRLLRRLGGLRRLSMTRSPTLGSHRAADGPRRGRAALLAGCVQDVWFTSINQAAIELLVAARFDVSVPTAQTCCGALAAHDGAAKAAGRLAAENAGAFAGYDVVVATAAGCSAHLSGYAEWAPGAGIESTARDITVVVAEALAAGLLPSFPSTGRRVAMQDPCHLRHAQGVVEETRRIVEAAGLVAVEVDPNGVCCGAAGIYVLRRPETADELGRMKADQVRASGARLVASANPGCEMQLRSNLDDSYTIRHPIEFYADALRSRPG